MKIVKEKMNSERKIAILAGVLFIIATGAGMLSVVFLTPVLDTSDYLFKISANETQLIIGTFLILVMAFAGAGIAISLYPVLSKHNKGLALGSVCFRLMEDVLFIVGTASLLSLLTLSQEFIKAGNLDGSYFQIFGTLLIAMRI